MAKSGNRIHGTLHARISSPWGTKKFLAEWMEDEGWELVWVKETPAGGSPCTEWFAKKGMERICLGVNLPADRINWKDATEVFALSCLKLSWNELEHIKGNC